MKQILSVTALAIVILALMLNQTSKQASKLIVGVSLPLTGEIAEFGQAVKNGIELAQSEAPNEFSNIQFVYEDNRYQAKAAISAYNNLRNVHSVDMIFDWGETTLGAIAPIAEKNKMPVIGMSLDPEPSVEKEFIVRSINHASQFSKTTLNYIRKKGFKRIAVVHTEDPFTNSMLAGLKEQLSKDETLKVIATVHPTEMDFNSIILRLKNYNPDVLAVYLLPGQVSTFYRQSGAMNYQVATVGTDVFESRTEIAQSGGYMEGAVFPILYVPAKFAKRYQEVFGNDLHLAFAYNSYYVARLLAKTGDKKISANLKSSKQLLESLLTQASESDNYTLSYSKTAGRYLEFPLTMHRVVNGETRMFK